MKIATRLIWKDVAFIADDSVGTRGARIARRRVRITIATRIAGIRGEQKFAGKWFCHRASPMWLFFSAHHAMRATLSSLAPFAAIFRLLQ